MTRRKMPLLSTALPALALATLLSACCANGTCIKDPPCRCHENPCCLTDLQRKALEGGTHSLPAPRVWTYEGNHYALFTEKGQKEFEKDPSAFEEKGAVRLIRADRTWRVDMDPGDGYDLAPLAAQAVPYAKTPAK